MLLPPDISHNHGLSDATTTKLQNVLQLFPQVERAILFGSRAMGNFRNGSDIDLCLEGAELNYNVLLKILVAIDDLNLPYETDVLIKHQITHPPLLAHIETKGVEFFSRKSESH